MMNNLPVDPAMIALIELTAASDESMQKSLDIYSDNCSKKTSKYNVTFCCISIKLNVWIKAQTSARQQL